MTSHTKQILFFIGESGSGKTTLAKQFVATNSNFVRVNRDELRIELAGEGAGLRGRGFEQLVAKVEKSRASDALKAGKSVVVDNTHLSESSRLSWENFARHRAEFKTYRVMTPMDECIARDAKRTGKAHVGRAVIERQFLMSGRLPLDFSKKIVIVDIDGTLADHRDIRSPFDENKVLRDKPFQNVIDSVNALYYAGNTIMIVSGRHSTCGDDTIKWLDEKGVKFHHIFMRHGWDSRHDYIVKEEILDELLKVVPAEQIIQVIDDRVQVCQRVWLKRGLNLTPVCQGEFIPLPEWTPTHSADCKFVYFKGFGRCPDCGAVEAF